MANPMDELNRLEAKIDEQRRKSDKAKSITVGFGLLLLVFIIGYFVVIGYFVRQMLEPQFVTAMVAEKVTANIPQLRKMAEEQANAVIPAMVDDFVNNAIHKKLPEARMYLEHTITTEADAQLTASEEQIFGAFEQALSDHGDVIRDHAKALSTDAGRDELEESLYKVLTEAVKDPNLQVELHSYSLALEQVSGMLKYLAEPSNLLTPEEEQIRELVGVVREMSNRSDLSKTSLLPTNPSEASAEITNRDPRQ